VAVVLALVAAACSDDTSSSSSTTGDTSTSSSAPPVEVRTASLDDVEVSDDMAAEPVVTFEPAFVGTETQGRVVVEGDGEPVADGDWVNVDFVVVSGSTGQNQATTWGAIPETLPMSGDLQPAVRDEIVGTPVGSRLAVSVEAQGEWAILVIDIRSIVPKEASGTAVTPPAGLPTVAIADGAPTLTMPEGVEPSTELVAQTLIEGSGPPVEAGQLITVHYVGALYADGTVFDSSWSRGIPVTFSIGTGDVIPGWDSGLVGRNVGSRVLLVIPPEQGYGAQGNASAGISGTDTIVFVIDILAAS
jgi:peptidylprolyl isomerase